MELNQNKIILIISLFIIYLIKTIHTNESRVEQLTKTLFSKDLLDKKSILSLIQLLLTTKLLKENFQEINGPTDDPQTNYMLFLGKGNIQFENHQLNDISENVTEPTDYETTTTSSPSDLAKNKHLLKFVARNGYDVWQRFLVAPHNSSAEEIGANITDSIDSDYSSNELITNIIITTTEIPETDSKTKQNKGKYDQKLVKTLKKLYKPDLQMIETDNGFIKHEVKPPKWVKNIIENGSQKSHKTSTKTAKKTVNSINMGADKNLITKKANKKGLNKSGSVKSDKTVSNKYNNKNINNLIMSSTKKKPTVRTTLNPINKKSKKVIREKENNNRIGNVVIRGFNGLIRGIGSLFGLNSDEDYE